MFARWKRITFTNRSLIPWPLAMKKLILLGAILTVSYAMWQHHQPPCPPLPYRVDILDLRVESTKTAFLKPIEHAAQIWEDVIGRTLFIYDPALRWPSISSSTSASAT